MTKRLATFAALIAISAATTVAAQAASRSDPAQDQRENQITAQLNRGQIQGMSAPSMGYSGSYYPGVMPQGYGPNRGAPQEQIAQPPETSDDLSIIE